MNNKEIKNLINYDFDVLVVGAGHAGLEAAFAASNMKKNTCLVTLHESSIALMPCNPSIGGPAKGIVTREIDALGGMQAKIADRTQMQMKLLNSSKGPGVWSLRAQIDKIKYHEEFLKEVKKQENLTLMIGEVQSLIVENNEVLGVVVDGKNVYARTVILTTGTYLKSLTHRGNVNKEEGPNGLKFAKNLSSNLKELGLELIRLKTGTPARILRSSIDFSNMQVEPGSKGKWSFEHFNPTFLDYEDQVPCYIIHTTPKTHEIILENLTKSAMYGGMINGIGPRYCPSIEDKLVKFPEKPRHQIFVEPESYSLPTMYLGGFSTSMPIDVQKEMIQSLPGFENAVIDKYAYAIEYDAINPLQINSTLMIKNIKGLFSAGQINGTSGYEEAAAQGLIAGINACYFIDKKEPLILSRQESYIGVMIDDLVTKGVSEPYRLLTSRAEHRLYLRNDNADDRLLKYGYEAGLISQTNYDAYLKTKALIDEVLKKLKEKTVGQVDQLKFVVKKTNSSLFEYLKRPEVKLSDVIDYIDVDTNQLDDFSKAKIEILVKFEGYIKNQEDALKRLAKIPTISLKAIDDYKKVPNISLEAIDKLNKIKPLTLDQAARISGINLTDIIKLKFYIENH